jgi:DivIVA domain-containing protein
MDLERIERHRVQGFTPSRRGYDRHEVDRFIADLTEWIETDAARVLGDIAVKRKLELVGKSTSQILLATEEESEQLHAQAEQECAALKRRADEYAKKVRERADQDAHRTGEEASARAKRILDEAERRREQVEAVIAELDARRDSALRELERLQAELAATIGEHRSRARPDAVVQ